MLHQRVAVGSVVHVLDESEEEPWGWDTLGFEMNFATQMRERRIAKGWSQTELAKRITQQGLKFHQTTVQRIEIGERPLKLTEAMVIAVALGTRFETMIRSDSVELAYNELADYLKAGTFESFVRSADSVHQGIRRNVQNIPQLIQGYEDAVKTSGGLPLEVNLLEVARECVKINQAMEEGARTLAEQIQAAAHSLDALPRDYPPEFHAES